MIRSHSSVQQSACGRDDDVVELQDRIVRIDRLLLEDVQPGPGDAPVAQRLIERVLVDERAAGRADR